MAKFADEFVQSGQQLDVLVRPVLEDIKYLFDQMWSHEMVYGSHDSM